MDSEKFKSFIAEVEAINPGCIDTNEIWRCEFCAPDLIKRYVAIQDKLIYELREFDRELRETKITLFNVSLKADNLGLSFRQYQEDHPDGKERKETQEDKEGTAHHVV